jgi:FkbM family methyltransferase
MKIPKKKKILEALRHPSLIGYIAAKEYIKRYEGFSYRFDCNGEAQLIKALSSETIHTVFDVGANVGDWTTIALKNFPQATIHAFELASSTFADLQAKHPATGRVKANNVGLSSEVGTITYKDYGPHTTINTILEKVDYHDARLPFSKKQAALTTGDIYCAELDIESIDFLKIDVEGAEYQVLQGFVRMLRSNSIKVIQFEYGYANGDANFLMKDFFSLLNGYGYLIGPLKPQGVIFSDFKYPLNNFTSGPNFVAVLASESGLVNKLAGKPIPGFPR